MKSRLLVVASMLLLLLAALGADWAGAADLALSPDEVRRITRHGPWPAPTAGDPGNRFSTRPEAIALGQKLFFDARLSANGDMSCASCHQPALAFGDGLARSVGATVLDRNAPSLWNAAQQRWLGWDGAADSLWSQAIRPLLDRREMAGSAQHIVGVFARDADLSCRYTRAFDKAPAMEDAPSVLVHTAKALGAFVASLHSAPSAFDRFRVALVRSDRAGVMAYPLAAQRGLKTFIGKGGCANCHAGAMFSNGEFADIGVPFFVRPGVVDPGRHGGIVALRQDPYNLLGVHADAQSANVNMKTRHVDLQHRNFGEFKVPSLRNVAHTAPYMHGGQLATLEAVVDHYSELNLDRLHADGETLLKPLRLTSAEKTDMVAFLRSLSAPDATIWRARPIAACMPVRRPAR